MSNRQAITDGAATIATAIRVIDPDTDASTATPCADFDLETLVNHALGTTAALARLAAKEGLDPDDPWGSRTEAFDGSWPERLADQLEATAAAWDDDAAWQGSLDLGGGEQPAGSIGEMAFVEVMVHGWDVATAAGRAVSVPDQIGDELLSAVTSSAELGRKMGAYGPEVSVDGAASSFDKALGAAGRDPQWRPAG
ncbi:TIGR03086 family metal-binding protein [Microlunatus ginsengisoli]|uniref:TIGR03086 family metal-binding protein n=1 Tax=Microlunatus ginsengisoli TaxID=363863 RepID=A0ABP7AXF9_9ACTN